MARSGSTLIRLFLSSFLTSLIALAVISGVFSRSANAQEKSAGTFEGYITAVKPPDGFDVNGQHVTTSPETRYGSIGANDTDNDVTFRDAVQMGAYVRVTGPRNRKAKTTKADSVLIRDGMDKKLSGMGVIDKMIATGPESIFHADGYLIRITPDTQVSYRGDLKTLADVGTNTWMKYEGKRDTTGVIVATQASFIPARNGKIKANQVSADQEAAPSQDSLIDSVGNFKSVHTKVRMSGAGGWCGWHRVPADRALQERVRRVGISVVPAYQKQLAVDDSSKIHFRFYAVDEKQIRSAFSCSVGLVLVPRQVAERLKSDDQLAAVLADGVAHNLQWQSSRLIAENRGLLGAELAGTIVGAFVPGVYLATQVGGAVVGHEIDLRLEEQRGRMALSLVADSGYDPWQAPEAWRQLAPKKLSKDLDSLKYPDRSGYQLGILNLQYGTKSAVSQ